MKNYILFISVIAIAFAAGCGAAKKDESAARAPSGEPEASTVSFIDPDTISVGTVDKTQQEWKQILTPEEYDVLREEGTEPAFSSDLLNIKKPGIYYCAACGLPLFSSQAKFESGTGWPSFYQPIADKVVHKVKDRSMGMVRTEIECAQCGSHIGHVFEDGPQPTGLRYCMNGVAMHFKAQ